MYNFEKGKKQINKFNSSNIAIKVWKFLK